MLALVLLTLTPLASPGPVAGRVVVLPDIDETGALMPHTEGQRACLATLKERPNVELVAAGDVQRAVEDLARSGVTCSDVPCFARLGSFLGAREVWLPWWRPLPPTTTPRAVHLLRIDVETRETLVEERLRWPEPLQLPTATARLAAAEPWAGSLRIAVEPEGAQVAVDRHDVGPAPLAAVVDGLAPGAHQVRASLPDGATHLVTVVVPAGEVVDVELTVLNVGVAADSPRAPAPAVDDTPEPPAAVAGAATSSAEPPPHGGAPPESAGLGTATLAGGALLVVGLAGALAVASAAVGLASAGVLGAYAHLDVSQRFGLLLAADVMGGLTLVLLAAAAGGVGLLLWDGGAE